MVVGIGVGLVIWALEDFGAIFTGQVSDVNWGLLVALLAATFWPVATRDRSGSGDMHDGAAYRPSGSLAKQAPR